MSIDSKLDRILDKIKRCLALSKSSNETESATALRQAHKLMEQYNISNDDIRLSDIVFNDSDSPMPERPPVYISHLAHMIKRLFGCGVYLNFHHHQGKWRFTFVGLEMHAMIASYGFDTLMRQVKQARDDYLKNELKRVKVRTNKIKRADAFCLGWVTTVEKLVKDILPLQTDQELIETAMDAKLELQTTTARNRIGNGHGKRINQDFANGVKAGKAARLHHAMHGTSSPNLIS